MSVSVILLKNSPLNAVHGWQCYRLNNQTDIQICSQCIWDNHESTPAVMGNYSPEHDYKLLKPSPCLHNGSQVDDWMGLDEWNSWAQISSSRLKQEPRYCGFR
ncbi:hypothetical protein TNCV_699801 [Trichonephila clavipes]|nr:hypothetical protein TNCV_699801 [Trichonephila clavipes]